MSKLLKYSDPRSPNRRKTYNRVHIQRAPVFEPQTVDNFVTLGSFASTRPYDPFIRFNDLFFSGNRDFIIDFLMKSAPDGTIFKYDPRYNEILGRFDESGDLAPPSPDYTGKEPIIFDLEIGEREDLNIVLDLWFNLPNLIQNPIYLPNYNSGDPAPGTVPAMYGDLFPVDASEGSLLNFIREIPYLKSQHLTYIFDLPAEFDFDVYHHYAVHFNYNNHSYHIYVDGQELNRTLEVNALMGEDAPVDGIFSYELYATNFYGFPSLNYSRIFLPYNFGGVKSSELRFWNGSTTQAKINNFAFKRIDYLNHPNLLHYYPLVNYTANDPLQITDLVANTHGSFGKEGLTQTILWNEDETNYPAFSPIISQLVAVDTDLDSITISWAYDNLFDITGFDVYVDGSKYNDEELPLNSSNGYKITGLSPAINYKIQIYANGTIRVTENKSEILDAPTIDPDGGSGADPPSGYVEAFNANTPVTQYSACNHEYLTPPPDIPVPPAWSLFLEFPTENITDLDTALSDAVSTEIDIYFFADNGLELNLQSTPSADPNVRIIDGTAEGSFSLEIYHEIPEEETRPYFPKLQQLAEQTKDGTIESLHIWFNPSSLD